MLPRSTADAFGTKGRWLRVPLQSLNLRLCFRAGLCALHGRPPASRSTAAATSRPGRWRVAAPPRPRAASVVTSTAATGACQRLLLPAHHYCCMGMCGLNRDIALIVHLDPDTWSMAASALCYHAITVINLNVVIFVGSKPRKAAVTSRAAARWNRMPTGLSTANCSTGGLARRRLPSLRWPVSSARSRRQHPAAVRQSDGARAHRWVERLETIRSVVIPFSTTTGVQRPTAGMLIYFTVADTACMPESSFKLVLRFLSAFS